MDRKVIKRMRIIWKDGKEVERSAGEWMEVVLFFLVCIYLVGFILVYGLISVFIFKFI